MTYNNAGLEQFGRYQLLRRVGAGGMAEVFLARSTAAQGLAKRLVIKKIHPAYAKSKHFVRMFVDEAKIALGLNHPNIVQVFDFGHVGSAYYLAMEHVEGLDLLQLLQECAKLQRRIPHGLCAYVVQQIAKGLDYAHRKTDEHGEPLCIVHRDISPQNVIVSWDGAVKIVDFGIARARDVEEEEGIVKGKFAYMSPEQARGEPVDARSDIYSAGIVLFELALARPLFIGKGRELLEQVKASAIPRPRDCDPTVPTELEAIILRALAYHPRDRYPTARDFQQALGRFQMHLARSQDEPFDSATLAQFLAETIKQPRMAPAVGSPRPPVPAPPPRAMPHGTSPRKTPVLSPPFARTPVSLFADANQGALACAELAPAAPSLTFPSYPKGEAAETREKKHVFVIEGHVRGLSTLQEQAGEAHAREAMKDFYRIAENIAFKHEAHAHVPLPKSDRPDAFETFTFLVGLPVAGEDDASRAIRLSLDLVDALDGIGRDVEPELRLSVGIQRGSAIVKRAGGSSWGCELSEPASLIAKRLVSLAQGGEVLVGGGVYRLAKADWNFDEQGTVDLPDDLPVDTSPGAAEDEPPRRTKVFRLRGPKEREQRMRDRSGAHEIIGRELELKMLRDTYRDVLLTRSKRHVCVIGDPGIGKRALVNAFLAGFPPGEAAVMRSAARAATSDTPFSVPSDLLRDLLGLAEGADPREVQRRTGSLCAMLYPEQEQAPEVSALCEMVGMVLGLKAGKAKLDDLDPEERRRRIAAVLDRLEERLTKDRPLVMVLEDGHWADSQSWELLGEVLLEPTPRPVLTIVTARPDERTLELTTRPHVMSLTLDELGQEDRMRLCLMRFATEEDATPLAEDIVAKAGGNPFFIREIIDLLLERGILEPSRKAPGKLTWVRRDAEVQVPTSVEALVATRIDRLPPGEKEVLTRAAVFGRTFAEDAVEALVGRPVRDELARLCERGLVGGLDRKIGEHAGVPLDTAATILDPRPLVLPPLAFRNEMTMSVAYDLVPEDERAVLHVAVAERLSQAPDFRMGRDDAVVAHHLELGGKHDVAARRYLAAARHAISIHANVEAFQHLTRAIALLPRDAHAERYDARAEREAILRTWARRPQQLREIHHLRREAEALEDKARLAQAQMRLAEFYLDIGKAPAARRALAPALAHAHRSEDRLVLALVLRVEAAISHAIGENSEALDLCDRALALCGEDLKALTVRAQVCNTRGNALWNMSRHQEAIESYAEALVIYRKLRIPGKEAHALNNLGNIFSALGDYEEALVHYKRALKIVTELGDRSLLAVKLGNIGHLYLDLGVLEKSEQYLDKAISLAGQLGDLSTLADVTITSGQLALKHGEAFQAKEILERGLELANKSRSRYQEIRALVYLAMAQLMAEDPPEGPLELARSAAKLGHMARMPIGEIFGTAVEGLALRALGHPSEAADRSARAVAVLDQANETEGAEEILFIHARLASEAGRAEEARVAMERALQAMQSKAQGLTDPGLRQRFLSSSPARDILATWEQWSE
ncbi:MAG: protein kinase [Deltaproteobacteria bacterium]|nr:protein kinase [Deltaproteobacteria bacterium]